jgi:hypothetical protein
VDVLWVFNERVANWESKLPSESQELLNEAREGGLLSGLLQGDRTMETFPHIPTKDANYDPELVGLLSNLASYQVYELKDIIADMVRSTV